MITKRRSKTAKRSLQGFTLIEVILAVTILAIVMSITYNALSQIMQSKKVLDEQNDLKSLANSLMGRLTRELQLAYAGVGLLPPADNLKQAVSTRLNMLAESNELGEGYSSDTITFAALEGGQYLPDGGTHSGLVQIKYSLKENDLGRLHSPPSFSLVREEIPMTRPYDRAYTKIMVFPVSSGIVSLHFAFYSFDTEKWSSTWGEEPNLGLPDLVRFSIVLRGISGKLHEFSTVVPLHEVE